LAGIGGASLIEAVVRIGITRVEQPKKFAGEPDDENAARP
jgi:hypothetical protein